MINKCGCQREVSGVGKERFLFYFIFMDDCPGGCPGKRVWQEEYVFSVDRYSVFGGVRFCG